jgi:hypothetical protein
MRVVYRSGALQLELVLLSRRVVYDGGWILAVNLLLGQ